MLSTSETWEWYAEQRVLLLNTFRWAALGAGTGLCVGLGTRAFLWALKSAAFFTQKMNHGVWHAYFLLPLALPLCVWLIRTFAPTAKGHGTEAVISAIHERSGRIEWRVAPVKLLSTVLTLAFGGSVGKEGPCAQIGASITSLWADIMKLSDADRRRLVICGVGAGFAAVFGTPVSGAIFGVEVLYLGRIEYDVLFPCLVAGVIAHLVSGVSPPVADLAAQLPHLASHWFVAIAILSGIAFGLIGLFFIESLGLVERAAHRWIANPYWIAAIGGTILATTYTFLGDRCAGLGTDTIEGALAGAAPTLGLIFAAKIWTTSVTLETGGSGGIVTPLFFVGTTAGVAFAQLFHLPQGMMAAFGLVSMLAACANTPIAAAVMGMELLPRALGVYAALAGCTAFLMVGHRSVYASQRFGMAKAAGLRGGIDSTIGSARYRPAPV